MCRVEGGKQQTLAHILIRLQGPNFNTYSAAFLYFWRTMLLWRQIHIKAARSPTEQRWKKEKIHSQLLCTESFTTWLCFFSPLRLGSFFRTTSTSQTTHLISQPLGPLMFSCLMVIPQASSTITLKLFSTPVPLPSSKMWLEKNTQLCCLVSF